MTNNSLRMIKCTIILAAVALSLATGLIAQQPPVSKPDPAEIKLTPDVVQAVKDLSAAFKEANTAKGYFQAQVEKADARLAELNARLVAEFNHFCAKQRLDPDEHEWNDDLTAVRRKKTVPKPTTP